MKSLLIIGSILISYTCFSQNHISVGSNKNSDSLSLVSERAYQNLIDTFFFYYETKSPNAALNYLFYTNPWTRNAEEKTNTIKANLNATIKIIGEYSGREFITKKSIGSNFILCSYIVKYTRQPVRFTFILYKPKEEWMLFNFKYDDKLDDEMEDAANIYRLYENLPTK